MTGRKIVLIGGGSTTWTPGLVGKLLGHPDLAGSQIFLHDIDAEALELTYKTPAGKVANELVYRHDEPRLVMPQAYPVNLYPRRWTVIRWVGSEGLGSIFLRSLAM